MPDDLPPGLVAIPAEAKMWVRSAHAIMSVQAATPRANFTWQVANMGVAMKRNAGVHLLMDDPRNRWILHLDSDMAPPADAIHRLWATAEREDADLVQAATVKKRPPHEPTGGKVTARGEPSDPLRPWTSDPELRFDHPTGESLDRIRRPVELDFAGTGCLLVRRRVFEALDAPWFAARPNGAASDYNATLRMTDAGFRCVLDPTVRVGHVSTYAYGIEDAARAGRGP